MESSFIEQMCRARGTLRTVSVADTNTTILVPASSNRASLTFFGASERYQVGLIESADSVGAGVGIIVPQFSPTPVVLTLATHGDLVQQCFYVVANAKTSITYAEAILQRS